MALLRTIFWYLYFGGALVVLTPVMLHAQAKKRRGDSDSNSYIARYVKMWCSTLMKIAGVSVTVTGQEHIPQGRAVMFTPNHQGNYDIPLMLLYLDAPHGLVAKIETRKIPLVRTWMELLDCVFLDRASPRKAMQSMKQVQTLLEQGKSMIVFPEGTRSKGGPLNEFKAGAFKIACKAGVPIVPVVIDGSYRVMEQNGGLMKPAHIRVHILPPVETASLERAGEHALAQSTAQQITAVLQQDGSA